MKILILNGSPKRDASDTMHLTRAFTDGMNEVQKNVIHPLSVSAYEKEKATPHGIYSQPLSEVPCRVLQRTGEHS